jgi:glycosyltransferase involved in cell wall biosynthesis
MSFSPRKILYFDATGRGGGATTSLRTLLLDIDRKAYAPVLVFGDRGNGRRWGEEEVHEFSYAGFDNFDFFPAAWNLRWLFHLSRFMVHFPIDVVRTALLLRRIRPALVHLNAGQAVTFGLTARLMGYPVVWHVRELVSVNAFGGILDRLYGFCSRSIIAPSKAVASRLPRCAAKVLIIPNGVRIPSHQDVLLDEFRREVGLREGDFVVLLLSNKLDILKGYLFLAEVAGHLSACDRLIFLLAGHDEDPPVPAYHRFLRRVYRLRSGGRGEKSIIKDCWKGLTEQRKAFFTGYIDPCVAIAASTVVVCPNQAAEPFGRTVIEAYAQARPVIAMDLPALNELVIDGTTGWLLPPAVDGWVNLIASLYSDPDRVNAAAREAFKRSSLYSADRHARRVEKLYESILG